MNSVTHILGGLALTSLLCLHTEILDPMEVGAAAMGVIGSLLPDIDHPKSKISNTTLTTKPASFAISSTTRHRGFCHSLTFVAIVASALCGLVVPHVDFLTDGYVMWLSAGMFSHLLLDSLNPTGIKWLWPLGKYHHFAKIKTGSTGELLVGAMLIVVNIYTFLNLV